MRLIQCTMCVRGRIVRHVKRNMAKNETPTPALRPTVHAPLRDGIPQPAPSVRAAAPGPRRLLVVDDEEDLCEILRFNLESEGYRVDTACSAEEALEKIGAQSQRYDLILLDVMMDRMSGFEMAGVLRSRGDASPIVFLTALDSHDHQLQGFDLGADDYIAKPFSFDTVLARVRAVLRRCGGARAPEAAEPALLTLREQRILDLLASHPGRFFSRADILAAVWPDDALVGERAVDVHIARLRKKMGAQGACIVNKTHFGYRYNPPTA